MKNLGLLAMVLTGGWSGWPSSPLSGADEGKEDVKSPSVEQRIDEIDQRQRILERKWEIEKEAQEEKAKEAPVVSAGKDGFLLKSGNGDFQLHVGGYIQADGRFFLHDEQTHIPDQFLLRRVRPIFEGTVFKYFDYRLMPDFGGGQTILYDAYMDFKYWDKIRLRAGKFKEPVGLERLQSPRYMLFIERALPTNLVPNRDVGGEVYGEAVGGFIDYALGIFDGVADGGLTDGDVNDDKDFAGRVFAHPFKWTSFELLQGLGLGVAGTFGNQEGTVPTYKSGGQQTFFTYNSGVVTDGDHSRLTPQAYWYWRRFGLMGEYVVSSQEVDKKPLSAQIDNTAWQIVGSVVLTGENASYKGVIPRNNFDLRNGGWGAFELAARWNQLDVDRDAFRLGLSDPAKYAQRAQAWAVGLNWYLNPNIKIAIDFERTEFHGGAKNGGDREPENALLTRFQIAF